MENEYSDFDDFDTTEESSGPDAIEATNSTVDAVAALLMGDEADEEGEGKDNAKTALYDHEGETRPKQNRTFNAVELDRHGNRVFDGQQKEPVAEAREDLQAKQELLYESQINENKEQTVAEWNRITAQLNRLQEEFNSGLMDEDSFNQQSFALGQQAGQVRQMAYEAELAGYKIKEQREASHKALEELLGAEMWGTQEARVETTHSVIDFVKEMGIDEELIRDLEDPMIVRALATAAKNHVLVDEYKDTIAKQKAQIRRLKQSGKLKAEKAQRSMGVGAKRDSDHAINEVTKLLMDSGNARGGRK